MSTFTIKSSLVFNKIQKAWDQAQGNMVHASTTPQHQGEINTPQSPNMIRIPLSHDYNHPHPIAITWGGGTAMQNVVHMCMLVLRGCLIQLQNAEDRSSKDENPVDNCNDNDNILFDHNIQIYTTDLQ